MSAFILTHGSFNPVHRHHLEMMVRARECLEASGYTVVRGILAITSRRRLIQKGAAAVLDSHRLAALQLGCEAMPESPGWLSAEARGAECGSGKQLIRMLQPELLQECPGATLFKVIGADVAVRYPSELAGATVVVCRTGFTEEVRSLISKQGRIRSDLFVVEELSGEECSSTKLRAALEANDLACVEHICPAPVAEYLLENRFRLYSNGADSQDYGGKCAASLDECKIKNDKSSKYRVAESHGESNKSFTKADADELSQLQQYYIIQRKAELERSCISNAKCSKDENVVEWVSRMQELKVKQDLSLADAGKKESKVHASDGHSSASKLSLDAKQKARRWGKRSGELLESTESRNVHSAFGQYSSCQVFGISGSSRSGKSTLAGNLSHKYGRESCIVVGQDNFRLKGNQTSPESWVERNGCWLRDWETPKQTDWPSFCKAVRKAMRTSSIVLVEGFCLLHDDAMCKLLQGFIWVETEKDICSCRRMSYPKGWDRATYFEECIWAAHLRYRAAVFGEAYCLGESGKSAQFAPRTLLVAGHESPRTLCDQVYAEMNAWLESESSEYPCGSICDVSQELVADVA